MRGQPRVRRIRIQPAVVALFVAATCILLVLLWRHDASSAENDSVNVRLSKVTITDRLSKLKRARKSPETSQKVNAKQPVRPITSTWAKEKMNWVPEGELVMYRRFLHSLPVPAPEIELHPGDVVIDIGANLGKFTQAVREVCPQCIIISFEVVQEYAAYIHTALKPEDIDKTFVIANGLSNVTGKAKFFADKNNFGWNTLIGKMAQHDAMRQFEVDLLRLDDLDFDPIVQNIHSKVRLIKIDTEGAEAFVLSGGHEFLESLDPKPAIHLEIAWGKRENPNWDLEVKEFEWMFAHGWQRFDYQELTATSDAFVRPS